MSSLELIIFLAFSFTAPARLSFLATANNKIIEVPANGDFDTKRVWLFVNDQSFLSAGSELRISTKKNLFSAPSSFFPVDSCTNSLGGIYYFVDIPVDVQCFSIASVQKSGSKIVQATGWVDDIFPSRVYEITSSFSSKIRPRNANFAWKDKPDAFLLGMLLSSYISYSGSYENGYAAYEELNLYWFKYYVGDVENTSLETTFIYDYSKEQCENRASSGQKTRKVSVKNKISELSENHSQGVNQKKLTTARNNLIALISLAGCIALSVLFCVTLGWVRKKTKNGKK